METYSDYLEKQDAYYAEHFQSCNGCGQEVERLENIGNDIMRCRECAEDIRHIASASSQDSFDLCTYKRAV